MRQFSRFRAIAAATADAGAVQPPEAIDSTLAFSDGVGVLGE